MDMPLRDAGRRLRRVALILAIGTVPALAAEPYVGLWADDLKDCASKTVPPLTQVEAGAAYWGDFFCPMATFTPDGGAWIVHLECQDPMAGPGDGDSSHDYRFSVIDDKLHWDPIGEGTGSVLQRCPE